MHDIINERAKDIQDHRNTHTRFHVRKNIKSLASQAHIHPYAQPDYLLICLASSGG